VILKRVIESIPNSPDLQRRIFPGLVEYQTGTKEYPLEVLVSLL
jgi:hypothetical protein